MENRASQCQGLTGSCRSQRRLPRSAALETTWKVSDKQIPRFYTLATEYHIKDCLRITLHKGVCYSSGGLTSRLKFEYHYNKLRNCHKSNVLPTLVIFKFSTSEFVASKASKKKKTKSPWNNSGGVGVGG